MSHTTLSKVQNHAAFEATDTISEESNQPRGPLAWVLTRDDLPNLIEAIRNSVAVVMDLETTGIDEYAVSGGLSNGGVGARIVMASLTLPQKDANGDWDGVEPTSYIVPLSHPRSPFLGEWVKLMRLIARTMLKYRTPFVNHHAKFDARWVYATTGMDLTPLIAWDTQSTSHLIDETQSTKLKEVVPRTFGIPRWDDHDLSYPGAAEDVDFWELGEYAARDTYWTWRLYCHHLAQLFLDPSQPFLEPIGPEEVAEARLGKVAKYVSTPTARCLGMLEQRGFRLDIPYVRKHLKEQREISEQRLDWLADRYGLDRSKASTATAASWFKELTSLAVEESELKIMSMTKSGTPQWTKFVLGKQARQGSETAKMILEQRDAEKQAQFLQSWLEKVTPDGFIHATYRAGHVVTGRLSSAGPNMQQVSKKLRPAFIPRDGYYIADLDYSQLELRVAAHVFKVQPMIDAYHAGLDLHALFAADQLTRRARKIDPNAPLVSIEDVPEEERQKAKAGNFGLLYGQQAQGFRNYADAVYGVELSEIEAQEIYDGFFSTWEGMAEAHAETIRRAASRGYVTSPIGRRRLLPNIMDGNNYLRSGAERQALNAPIQGFGSDLMQMGIASIYGEMPGAIRVPDVYPVATVHDSLVAEVKIETWEETVAECQERMTNLDSWLGEMGVQLSVPLVADATVGTRWGVDDIRHG